MLVEPKGMLHIPLELPDYRILTPQEDLAGGGTPVVEIGTPESYQSKYFLEIEGFKKPLPLDPNYIKSVNQVRRGVYFVSDEIGKRLGFLESFQKGIVPALSDEKKAEAGSGLTM